MDLRFAAVNLLSLSLFLSLVAAPLILPQFIRDPPQAVSADNPNNATSKSLLVVIKDAFSNKTGRITKHQIIITQLATVSPNASISNWAASDSTKQPYIAIECPQFFGSQCPLASTVRSNRRRRQAENGDGGFAIVVGADDSCKTDATGLCNGNLVSSTTYYVIYRTCNEDGMCSTITSHRAMTIAGTFSLLAAGCTSFLQFIA